MRARSRAFTCPINFNVLQVYRFKVQINFTRPFFFFLQPPLHGPLPGWKGNAFGRKEVWKEEHWLMISAVVQLVITVMCIFRLFSVLQCAWWRFCEVMTASWRWWPESHLPPSLCMVSPRSLHCHGNQRFRSPQVSTVTDLLSFISVARATQPWLIDGILVVLQQRGWRRGSPNHWIFSPSKHLHHAYFILTAA